ncbi:MAG: deoxyguanosinetriphosphate triphosphohydrolase family protein [Methylocystaceae bacterium]
MEPWEQQALASIQERENLILGEYACKTALAERLRPELVPDELNIRPAFFHDTDRIIHSRAYARYIDKTQVFFLFDNDHITHRVLHVQLVAKISRTIGRLLRLNEDLIEAIALGHDLGHAPFGHDGENYLNELCQGQGVGLFCHNAQSVRFLMELENEGQGLNLTLQVLDGVLCHNGEFIEEVYEPAGSKSWEELLEQYSRCWREPGYNRTLVPGTLEGCVVRIADVIAYIGRDIEDAITVGLIRRDQVPTEITKLLGYTNREIINTLVRDLVANSLGHNYLKFSPPILQALLALKDFNYHQIYFNPRIRTQDYKIKGMFELLFTGYLREAKEQCPRSIAFADHMVASQGRGTAPARMVADFIAGMTDKYFLEQFRQYFMPEQFGHLISE